MENKTIFIRGDLNALHNGVLPLRNQTWIKVLRKVYGNITDGQDIWLFEDTEHNGKMDPTIFPGKIRDLGKEDEYEILVDEKKMQYLSETKQFKGYSVEDVINQRLFEEMQENEKD